MQCEAVISRCERSQSHRSFRVADSLTFKIVDRKYPPFFCLLVSAFTRQSDDESSSLRCIGLLCCIYFRRTTRGLLKNLDGRKVNASPSRASESRELPVPQRTRAQTRVRPVIEDWGITAAGAASIAVSIIKQRVALKQANEQTIR